MRRAVCLLTVLALLFTLCGCLPDAKVKGITSGPYTYVEIGARGDTVYAYKIYYDGDYTALTAEQQQLLTQTELLEITPYKTSTVYKCDGVREYFMYDDGGKSSNCIFFYTVTGTDTYEVYSYNIKSGYFQTVAASPASNIVIPDTDYTHAWVAANATLYAVNLDDGKIDTDSTYDLENSELLFYSEGQEFDRKTTRLYTCAASNVVCFNIEYYVNGQTAPASSYTYLFETTTRTYIGPFEDTLLN